MANNFKRMQKLAGLITESQYRESINEMTEDEKYDLLYNFVDEKMVEGDRIAEKIISGKLPNKYDDLYAFVDDKMVEGDEDAKRLLRKINKAKANESQLNENKPYAMLATVADDWGKDSDLYGDLEAAVVGWTDRNGELSPKGKIAIKNLLANWDLLDDYGFFIDNDEMNEGDTDYDRAKDAKRLGKKGEKNIYGAGVEKGEEIEKKKMKMSELKAAIKELALSEGEDDVNFNDDESLYDPVYESVWSVLPARIPEFIQKIKDIKDEYHAVVGSDDVYDGLDYAISAAEKLMSSELSEAKKDEEVKSDKFTIGTDKSNPLHPSFFVYNTETGEKSKVFKTKKEAEELMNSKLNEAKKDEEVEDIKDVDVTVGDEETTADVTTVDVDPNVKAVQDALTQAQAAAEKLGDDKLTDQIGNTITFFTRTHVVEKPGMTAESNIKERINKLVKSLNETAVDEEKDTDTLTQKDIKALYSKGFNIIAPPDWNFVRIQKDFKSLKADWRFLNNLLSSKNIPSDIDYWRGDGDKGRNKRLEISKKYFDQNIKYPAFK